MFEDYTVAGFVGGLAPRTMAFHELFFQVTLVQGKQSRAVLLARHLHRSGGHSWQAQRRLLLEPPVPPAHPDQWRGETEQSPGAHRGCGSEWQDLGWGKNEAIFSLCSQDDSQASNMAIYTISVTVLRAHGTQGTRKGR